MRPGRTTRLPLSKRAAMTALPIHADPSMWTDEQIAEVLRTRGLLETLRDDRTEVSRPTGPVSRVRAFLEEASKRGILRPRDIGKWRERGIWGLWLGVDILGFFRDAGEASMAKRRIVDMFASGGFKALPEPIETSIEWLVDDELQAGLSAEAYQLWHKGIGKTRDMEVWESMNSPLVSGRRRALAEKALNIAKASEGFKPLPGALVEGGIPTEGNKQAARDSTRTEDEEGFTILPEFEEQKQQSDVAGMGAAADFVRPWIDELNREADVEHPEHEFMVGKKSFLLPMSKRAISMEEWRAAEREKNPPAPPDAFWAIHHGINWSWYALLLPEEGGFRVLKHDRLHHGEGAHPRTRTSFDFKEDKERNVVGVNLRGEHSTPLNEPAPVTNPKHVFSYPGITFEDEESFAKEREAAPPLSKREEPAQEADDLDLETVYRATGVGIDLLRKLSPQEFRHVARTRDPRLARQFAMEYLSKRKRPAEASSRRPPLSKRAYEVDYWIKWARKTIELGEKLSHDKLEAEGMADMRAMLDDAERQGSAVKPEMVHSLFRWITKTIGRRAIASMRAGADLIESEKGGSKALDGVRKTIDTLEEILLEGTDPARIQHWMLALHEVALQLHGIEHEEDRERALQEYFRQRDLAKRKKEMKLVPMPEGAEPPGNGAPHPKPELRLVPKASRRPPLSKRAAADLAMGEQVSLKGFGRMRFEVVDLKKMDEETYYKIKPVDTFYWVPEKLIEEKRHSETTALGGARFPLSKRADEETPIIPIEHERSKRVIEEIREENMRKIKEMGLDRPLEYPQNVRFFGEQFLPGDYITTRDEPTKVWQVMKRSEEFERFVSYSSRSMEEKIIPAEDVVRGAKGSYVLELPKSQWDVPGKGLPPKTHVSPTHEERHTFQTEAARRRWDRLQPLAKKLLARMERLLETIPRTGEQGDPWYDVQNIKGNLRHHLESGFRDYVSTSRLENDIRRAYWRLKSIPEETGYRRRMSRLHEQLVLETRKLMWRLEKVKRYPVAKELLRRLERSLKSIEGRETPKEEFGFHDIKEEILQAKTWLSQIGE